MKLPVLLQQHYTTRRANSFRTSPAQDGGGAVDGLLKSPAAIFWLLLHGLCCLISLVLGFRFSRIVFFLFFYSSSSTPYTPAPILHTPTPLSLHSPPSSSSSAPPISLNQTAGSHVVVGRHGIRIRPWPHPNPSEVVQAHRIIQRVQREQRAQYGIRNPRPLIVVTPTYIRTFQTLHLTSLTHSLMLVPYDLVWVVVEAGGVSNETAAILAKSKLHVIHLPFSEKMPVEWPSRHQTESRMRLHALRVVRQRRLDGIVVFADDSNINSMELFDEVQSVRWFGALSIGILAHMGDSEPSPQTQVDREFKENALLPIQGPACNSSGHLVGWHTFSSSPYVEDKATVLPRKLEWAGFVLNSRLLWEAEDKPIWIRELDTVPKNGDEIESPLDLLKDASFVEPLGNCGRKIMLWWLRVEARSDSKFPSGWIINPPLEITVPAKHTPWPDAPPEIPSEKSTIRLSQDHVEKLTVRLSQDHVEKRPAKISRSRTSRSRHSRSKRKRESPVYRQGAGVSQRHVQEERDHI